ncbi:hypothetical protein G7Z17_g13394 [Cylindrodendrum hubeiense]|uniref:Uncharacterized protein n=1 Tax=Cylindrodendrum hubeiense TaxID=595255 RepID=A0A9P5H139_9HYPO|nr:hypothetical protein G7Z17_g13394 [Cylindrodendrum hubeiense]
MLEIDIQVSTTGLTAFVAKRPGQVALDRKEEVAKVGVVALCWGVKDGVKISYYTECSGQQPLSSEDPRAEDDLCLQMASFKVKISSKAFKPATFRNITGMLSSGQCSSNENTNQETRILPITLHKLDIETLDEIFSETIKLPGGQTVARMLETKNGSYTKRLLEVDSASRLAELVNDACYPPGKQTKTIMSKELRQDICNI